MAQNGRRPYTSRPRPSRLWQLERRFACGIETLNPVRSRSSPISPKPCQNLRFSLFGTLVDSASVAFGSDPAFLLPEMRPGADEWLLRVETWGYSEPSTRTYVRSDGAVQTLRDNKRTKEWKVI